MTFRTWSNRAKDSGSRNPACGRAEREEMHDARQVVRDWVRLQSGCRCAWYLLRDYYYEWREEDWMGWYIAAE